MEHRRSNSPQDSNNPDLETEGSLLWEPPAPQVLGKRKCINLHEKEFPDLATNELRNVIAAREDYRKILRESGSVHDYMDMLNRIDALFPQAVKIISDHLRYISRKN